MQAAEKLPKRRMEEHIFGRQKKINKKWLGNTDFMFAFLTQPGHV